VKGRDHMEGLVYEKKMFKRLLKKSDGRVWTELSSSSYGQVAGSCEQDVEVSGFIKC
jgi:hypothetical protein